MKKILFISHDASRTGAPILLLNLFNAVKNDYEIHFLIKNSGGELENRFTNLTKTFIANKNNQNFISRIVKKLFPSEKKYTFKNIQIENYDLIISNTITNGDILKEIRKIYLGPIVSYIHELEMATQFFTSERDLSNLIVSTDQFVTPSNSVREHLIKNLGIPKNIIGYLPYYISSLKPPVKNKESETFVVGSSGTIDWRKGVDLFLAVAVLTFKKYPTINLQFKWKGATPGINLDRLMYEIEKTGLNDRIEFLKASDEIGAFYNQLDVFLLTSREDPYPLVVLEAANHHIPSIAFENVGGAPEFISASNGGKLVPFRDIEAIVTEIFFYYNDRDLCRKDGEKAKLLLEETHANAKYIKNRFKELIESNGK